MKWLYTTLIAVLCFCTLQAYAQTQILTVGIKQNNPPFSMQANNQFFGFDVAMMMSICKRMDVTCKFKPMNFDLLLQAVANKEVDVAAGSITITQERMQEVNFTTPYLLSYARFLTLSSNAKKAFSLTQLNGSKIGIIKGSIFKAQILSLGITNANIQEYTTDNNLISALQNQQVDYLLLDGPSALYWAANSSGIFKTIGGRYMYGLGFGLAVSKDNNKLLSQLNEVLKAYENSIDYKQNYNQYIKSF